MTEILKGSAYERWVVPNIDEPHGFASSLEDEATMEDMEEELPNLPTVEEIEAIQSAAHEEGLQQGKEEGLKLGQEEAQTILNDELEKLEQQRQQLETEREQMQAELAAEQAQVHQSAEYLQDILNKMTQPLNDMDDVVESQLLQLSITVARQLVRRELKTEPGEIIAVIREAVPLLPVNAGQVQIKLHPEDLALVTESLSLGEEGERPWKLIEDPMITRGGCIVVSDDSQIDATVERRLSAVASKLLGHERSHESS
ncbi:MAG: flagellar assembly protein FliH [Gammaproteobacteria bacterium]|nr:flagellar assembly protein FliH [Gammaproteobacteria bacterium]